MSSRRPGSEKVVKNMDIFTAMKASILNLEFTLRMLKAPINDSEAKQLKLKSDLKAYLKDLYTNVKIGIRSGSIMQDPVGILDNNFVMSVNPIITQQYPHHILLKPLIQSIIDEDTTMPRKAAAPKTPVVENANTPENTKETKNMTTNTTKAPAKKVTPPLSFNEAFHKPYVDRLEEILKASTDLDEEDRDAIRAVRKDLNDTTKEWVETFYQNIINMELEENITADLVGLHTNTTMFSDPDTLLDYPMAKVINARITSCIEALKSKSSKLEVAVWYLADVVLKAYNNDEKVFELEYTYKNKEGKDVTETLIVNKETKEVSVKVGEKLTCFGKIYQGIKNILNWIYDKLVGFKDWVFGWFKKGKKEEPKVMSEEEADAADAKAAKNAQKLLTA